ncbi:M48 family peptidase [Caproiciproducens sp. NJN-50]|uniref:M48 family metallopeptidase n=1 Tax=Acutalibacteraceae TaxID=3082771 RepID=UPI000FFE082F|nr:MULTISPECIES: SprT family zinc-dependent metalloprotease [Acutalibacteraceae]QAT49340.1 M48 family peptidase [Caproiciproducens sp. NJN-50]
MSHTLRIERSKRRTLSLSITRDGAVLVRAPLFLESEEIESFVRRHEEWIERQLSLWKERAAREAALMLTPEKTAALKQRAQVYLSGRVRHYSKIMGVSPIGIKITSAKTRWGSCSAKNSLCFSYRLILLDPEAVDYVVVHELAHIRVKNHGPEFYREVERYLPDFRRRIALLRESQQKIGL